MRNQSELDARAVPPVVRHVPPAREVQEGRVVSPARNAGVGALHRAHVARLSVYQASRLIWLCAGRFVDFCGQSEQGVDAVRDEGTGSGGPGLAVPVILATPGEWEKSQGIVWSGAGLWSALVILTGIFNVVPA